MTHRTTNSIASVQPVGGVGDAEHSDGLALGVLAGLTAVSGDRHAADLGVSLGRALLLVVGGAGTGST